MMLLSRTGIGHPTHTVEVSFCEGEGLPTFKVGEQVYWTGSECWALRPLDAHALKAWLRTDYDPHRIEAANAHGEVTDGKAYV